MSSLGGWLLWLALGLAVALAVAELEAAGWPDRERRP